MRNLESVQVSVIARLEKAIQKFSGGVDAKYWSEPLVLLRECLTLLSAQESAGTPLRDYRGCCLEFVPSTRSGAGKGACHNCAWLDVDHSQSSAGTPTTAEETRVDEHTAITPERATASTHEVLHALRDELHDKAQDLFLDAAVWREASDMGAPRDQRIATNEAAAAALEEVVDRLDEIAALSSAGTGPNLWQPIETAPKDGTEILLGRDRNGRWLADRAYWLADPSDGGPEWDGDWWHVYPPTHWMPLPYPPASLTSAQPPQEEKS